MAEALEQKQNLNVQEEHLRAGIGTDIGTFIPSAIHEGEQDYLSVQNTLEAPRADATQEELFDELVRIILSYKPDEDISMIRKAYEVAAEQHKDQKRRSGEPYIIHPLNTAIILAEMEMDKETIMGALLHDVVEDTDMTLDQLREIFGDDVANMVSGVTKLTQLNYDMDKVEMQAENLRKMFVAMAKDIRVVLIKLADRLHNLRTLQYQSKAKQQEKARETLDIYSPIAERLGISKMKIELDDISLKYLEPDVYKDLVEKIVLKKEEREKIIADIAAEVSEHLEEADINAIVVGRVKHFFSIYKKMVNQNKTIDQIYDLFAVRILVESVKDCYAALGVIHEMYKPIPGRFKDYIAMPKPNMYQSLHTTLIGRDGTPFEIQIRTFEMHKVAEYGIAAHWKYKESGGSTQKADSADDEKMGWLRQVLEWQKDTGDNKEFLSMVKSDFDLFNENVYCFTPTGEVKSLPMGSTPIDFAYSIHSAVGNKMVGARVNGRLVPIDYKLQSGDQIEIVTSQNSKGPSHDWLSIVKSTQARNKINAWFKTENKEENIARGRDLLEKYCKSKGLTLGELTKPEYVEAALRRYALKDWNAVLASVGHGGLKESQIIGKLMDTKRQYERKNVTDEDVLKASSGETPDIVNPAVHKSLKGGIIVKGIDDVAARCAHCCNPVPGDEIVGFVTRGRGITVHRTDCINMINLPPEERNRLIEAEWEGSDEGNDTYSAEIRIYCNNRIGLLVDISRVFTEANIDITSINLKNAKNGTCTLNLTFDIHTKAELTHILEKLRGVRDVLDVQRTTG